MEKNEQPNILEGEAERVDKETEKSSELGNSENAVNQRTRFVNYYEEEARKEREKIKEIMKKTEEIEKETEDLFLNKKD